MGKAARLKRERAAGLRRQPESDAPRPQRGRNQSTPRKRPRHGRGRGDYDFMFPNRGKPARRSAADSMTTKSKDAALRNGVSRGAPGRTRRRNDPRTWTEEEKRVVPLKGARRASFRARWMTGAIFRGRLTGKRYVDLDVVEEKQGK